jgi:TonB family protein
MSFFRTATEQRIKEAKSVKSFLSISLIGSLAVHVGVLASGIGNLLSVAPQSEEDTPIEIAFVEPQTKETPKQPEEKRQQSHSSPLPVPLRESPVKQAEQQELPPERQPTQEVPKTTEVPKQRVEQSVEKTASETPQNSAATAAETSSAEPLANNDSQGTGVLTNSGTESSVAFGSGTGIGSGDSNGMGSGRRKRGTIATGSSAPNPPTELRRNSRESGGSGDGRAACRECNTAYPEEAKRNGVEGRVEVAVDTDAEGNVTNARIVRSSGNRDLDEATLRQARDWKLKPSGNRRQGTRIATEYAIEGSQRHRELQGRARQRQTTAVQPGRTRRQMETATNSTSTSATRQRSRQSNVATRSTSRTSSYTPRRQQSTTQPSRRVRRTNVATGSVRNSAATSTRRKRRQTVLSNSSNRARQPITRRRRESGVSNHGRVSRRQRQLAAPVAPKSSLMKNE